MANPSCIPEIYSYHLQYNPEGFTVISIELLASWLLKYIKCYLSEHFLLASTYQSQIIKLIATAEHKRTQGLTFPYNLLCFSTCDTMILMHGVITACHASLHEWQGTYIGHTKQLPTYKLIYASPANTSANYNSINQGAWYNFTSILYICTVATSHVIHNFFNS